MALRVVPEKFDSVFENQVFFTSVAFYEGNSPIRNVSSITAQYQIVGSSWGPFPSFLTATLVTADAGFKEIRLAGTWPKYTVASSWVTRPSESSTSTSSYSSYENVVANGSPYYAAVEYNPDTSISTSALIRIDARRSTGAVETLYIYQTVSNNWTRKRNQIIPFVQGGSADTTTFRYPGGSLGGSPGLDLPEPPNYGGVTLFQATAEYTSGAGFFTVPASVSSITVQIQGAGGRGGRAYALQKYNASGGGGGGGGYIEFTTSVTSGHQFKWYVGEGGSEKNQGNGQDTGFGEYTVTGGKQGGSVSLNTAFTSIPGGQGGTPAGKDGLPGTIVTKATPQEVNDVVGGNGADALDPNLGLGGAGGNKLIHEAAAGQPGTGYGSGGGGAGTWTGTVQPWYGADGQPGRVLVKFLVLRYVFNDQITTDTANYSIAEQAKAAGWDGVSPLDANIIVRSSAYVYSTNSSIAAISCLGVPLNSAVSIRNEGAILGCGGKGGGAPGALGAENGFSGGNALIREPGVDLTIVNTAGAYILGGGGGGGGGNGANGGSGGGGGAGGGRGGYGYNPFTSASAAGGAGGAPRAAGARGEQAGWLTGFYGGGFGAAAGGGGGGGRTIPGAGGKGGPAPGHNTAANSWTNVWGLGGGSGGGGGGFDGWYVGGPGGFVTSGGSGSSNATSRLIPGSIATGAGGGGWAAAGGSGGIPTRILAGGVGGKAIETNGYAVVVTNAGTIWGAISGSSASTYSTAIFENTASLNLHDYIVNVGWNGVQKALATIGTDVYVYSDGSYTPSLSIDGSWPNGVQINNYGFIIGKGGNGGGTESSLTAYVPAFPGGTALYIQNDVTIENYGYIAGGGGGGGSYLYYGGGGGGAGGGTGGGSRNPTTTVGVYVWAAGGAGGEPGAVGGDGDRTSGAGGGRVLPGEGGAGGFADFSGGTITSAGGGGAGGGGGGYFGINADMTWDGTFANGGAGGSGTDAAGNTELSTTGLPAQGAGGGGWGAAGGNQSYVGDIGGVGGKAIDLNGSVVTFTVIGSIYGAVS